MLQPGTQLGDYRLLRRIGSGGMAEVFLAQKVGAEGFARTVAIKTIIAHGTEDESINLFLDEARVASFLNHPAIVETLDLGFADETLFIVMEYIAGPPLSRIIRDLKKSKRHLAPEIVAYTGARVASALEYAHRRAAAPDGQPLALVHRDISPQNIMLTRNGLVKLTDFGVARASTQTHKTKTGQVRGKASYMAPEQVRAKDLDGRTDVFALGIVLYEALTAVRAFQRKTDINSMRAVLSDSVKPIREFNRDAPDDLIAAIDKAIRKDPAERWQSAGDFEAALLACCRKKASSRIETDIKNLIEELFGPEENYADAEGVPIESWQPTMQAAGAVATPKLPTTGLSPRMREMLATPPSGSQSIATTTPDTAPLDTTPLLFVTQPSAPRPKRRAPMWIALPILGALFAATILAVVRQREVSAPPPLPVNEPEPKPEPRVNAIQGQPPPPTPPPPPAEKKIERTPKPKTPRVQNASPPPPPAAKPNPDQFKTRAVNAWRAHQQRGNKDWSDKLQTLVINLGLRPPSPDDEHLLRDAETALGSR